MPKQQMGKHIILVLNDQIDAEKHHIILALITIRVSKRNVTFQTTLIHKIHLWVLCYSFVLSLLKYDQ
jgi:hypothetical protein